MKAVLYSAKKPSIEITKKFEAFLNDKYGEVELEWKESDLKSGFKLLVGDDVYYWDANSKFEQLKTVAKVKKQRQYHSFTSRFIR